MNAFASDCLHPARMVAARLASRETEYGIAASDLARVEAIWAELGHNGQRPPFEGVAINVLDIAIEAGRVSIACAPMRYRCVVARHREALPSIMPFAVSGVLWRRIAGGDEVLIGRRSTSSFSHGGWFETPPSGGVEIADARRDGSLMLEDRLLDELGQETGWKGLSPRLCLLGLFRDGSANTLDILYAMELDGDVRPPVPTAEYDSLEWAAGPRVAALLAEPARVVPASRCLLEAVMQPQSVGCSVPVRQGARQ